VNLLAKDAQTQEAAAQQFERDIIYYILFVGSKLILNLQLRVLLARGSKAYDGPLALDNFLVHVHVVVVAQAYDPQQAVSLVCDAFGEGKESFGCTNSCEFIRKRDHRVELDFQPGSFISRLPTNILYLVGGELPNSWTRVADVWPF